MKKLQTTIDHKGQPYYHRPVYQILNPRPIAKEFGMPPIRALQGYERVKLQWIGTEDRTNGQ